MPADRGAGRACPVSYRYSPEIFDRSPQIRVHTAYVVGGLYGIREALDTILAMAQGEHGGDVLLIFNGDFNWLDVRGDDFAHLNETVLRHVAARGNVEAELATEESDAGCGCAYPDYVDEAVVTRSNAIMARLRATAMAYPELRRRLQDLPMTLCIEVGSERIAILHGDPESLAGWNFAVEGRSTGLRLHAHGPTLCAAICSRRARAPGHQQRLGRNAQLRGHALRCDHAGLGGPTHPGGQPLRLSARRTAGRCLAGAL
jgi:hypothetical protein